MKSWIIALLFVFSLFIIPATRPVHAAETTTLWLNDAAPDFSLENTEGKKVSLGQFKGKNPVIVAFWHPQMGTSVQQLKELQDMLKDKAFKDVKVLAVTSGSEVKDRDAAREAFKQAGVSFPILFEKRTDASAAPVTYMVTGLPAFYVVDKAGKLVAPPVTFVTEDIGGKKFSQILKEALAGKTMSACAFAPEDHPDDPNYKPLYALIGKKAPDFSVTDSNGVKQSLSYYKGKKNVLLIFFYPSCPHCRRELPQLSSYNDKWAKKQNVQLLAVNIDNKDQAKTDAVKFFKLFDMKFPLINQKNDEVSGVYGVHSVPTLFLIDKKGIVRKVFVGEFAMPGDVIQCLAGTLD